MTHSSLHMQVRRRRDGQIYLKPEPQQYKELEVSHIRWPHDTEAHSSFEHTACWYINKKYDFKH